MKGDEDICQRAFAQIRHWPPGGVDVEDGETKRKSALRKSKDTNPKRASISWSSKVTCKTYSKDDPNNYKFFNANASTSEGMNFNGHSDPLYDPHAQNEARVLGENQPNDAPANNFDPYAPNAANFPNNGHEQQPQQNQPPPNQHLDQYYGTGVDYENQAPDPMYGDSQNQDVNQGDGNSWEGSDGTGSYEQQSGSTGTAGSFTTGSHSSGSGSYSRSDGSSRSDGPSSFTQQQNPNGNPEFVGEDGSDGTYEESAGSAGSSRSSGNYSHDNPGGQEEEFYEAEVYEDEQNWDDAGDGQETGSYSTGSSASGGLPPVT